MAGKCKRAFVIGLDGAIGGSVREAATSNIDEILCEGVVDYSAQTGFFPPRRVSRPGALCSTELARRNIG